MGRKRLLEEEQLIDLVRYVRSGIPWNVIVDEMNQKWDENWTYFQIYQSYRLHGQSVMHPVDEVSIAHIKEAHRIKKSSSKIQRENRAIINQLVKEEDIVDHIKIAVDSLNRRPSTRNPYKFRKDSKKKSMTLELLLSDIHYGKRTDTFNLVKCRERLQHVVAVLIREVKDQSKSFNVDRVIVALLGDIIESSTMHGIESAKSCEFGNAQQVQEAIVSLFEDVLEPLAELKIPIDVPSVTGNHDRTEVKRTYHNPGEENLTWIIYNSLAFLCKRAGWDHVKFNIAKGPYLVEHIYKDAVLYEHFDNVKANSRPAMEAHMMKRQKQVGTVLKFMRGGHWHESTMYGRGTIIVNGSVPGQDSFADVLGFDSEASQTINLYIENETRPTSFYKSFPVHLK